jgi:LacI family transcriptional regulator
MASTLKDVAQAAGVHTGTASKALNAETRHLVAEVTAKRVLAAAKKLRYQPNDIARSLRTRRSQMVGVLVPDLTNSLFPPIVRGIEHVLSDSGLQAIVLNTDNNIEKASELFSTLWARQCDGFIIASAFREDKLIEEIAEREIPAVLVNRLTDKRLLPTVSGDEWSGVHIAVNYLSSLGHTSIAHIAGPKNVSTGNIRRQAFIDAISRIGLKKEDCPVVVASEYSDTAGRIAAKKLLANPKKRPTAIFAGNDQIAIGVLDAIDAAGLSCPADISVVGFNNIPLMERVNPSLTTIHLPKRRVGEAAALILKEIISGEVMHGPEVHMLPCEIIIRDSTARI